jgi:uncharacterized protein YdeI (YjbR/CyaY-like superfamily)
MNPIFFDSPAAFRRWLRANHAEETELWVGYHRKETGRPSMTWSDSVDEALCFGWIDGIRKKVSDEAYMIRFTPRKPRSVWSDVNIAKVAALTAAGRMRAAGVKAFAARDEERSGVYAFERKTAALSDEELAAFRKKAKAWKFWEAQPNGYRRTAMHWVASAKRPETRARRFATLLADSAAGLRIASQRR